MIILLFSNVRTRRDDIKTNEMKRVERKNRKIIIKNKPSPYARKNISIKPNRRFDRIVSSLGFRPSVRPSVRRSGPIYTTTAAHAMNIHDGWIIYYNFLYIYNVRRVLTIRNKVMLWVRMCVCTTTTGL